MAANSISEKSADILAELRIKQTFSGARELWEVPHGVETQEGPHGYFRYIGKFPPQIARAIIEEYSSPKDSILDPMCGGGTVLTEAILAGRKRIIGYDVNPVAMTVARTASAVCVPTQLKKVASEIIAQLPETNRPLLSKPASKKADLINLGENSKFFTADAWQDLSQLFRAIEKVESPEIKDFLQTAFFAILRRVSLCNVKKMNIEFDREKKKVWPVAELFSKTLQKNIELHDAFARDAGTRKFERIVRRQNAIEFDPADKAIGLVVAHPPYMSNTAFSESTQLQLAFLGVDHKTIWKSELRHRGSYLHEPNGVQKYLVGWCKIVRQAFSVLKRGGHFAAVVGDGQVDTVRIPVGTITREFCEDTGFEVVRYAEHVLNNNTGRTLNRRMRTQHIVIARKP
ncbi:MAG: site-specific DNA-methyltransferase [Planctomycetia bacterium]|nr:site-specific DNA-methyltransferase [Planctomycetia bacterium]